MVGTEWNAAADDVIIGTTGCAIDTEGSSAEAHGVGDASKLTGGVGEAEGVMSCAAWTCCCGAGSASLPCDTDTAAAALLRTASVDDAWRSATGVLLSGTDVSADSV